MIFGVIISYLYYDKGLVFLMALVSFVILIDCLYKTKLMLTLACLLGMIVMIISINSEAKAIPKQFEGSHVEFKAVVTDVYNNGSGKKNLMCEIIEIKEGNNVVKFGEEPYKIVKPKALLYVNDKSFIKYAEYKMIGQTLTVIGEARMPEVNTNPRCFNFRNWLYSKGIDFEIHAENITVDIYGNNGSIILSAKKMIYEYRTNFVDSIALNQDTHNLMYGILFGLDDAIDEDTLKEFRGNATAHILAVSGLHIGILYLAYRAIKNKMNSKILDAVFIIFITIYSTAAMWSIPVFRAFCIIVIKMFADRGNYKFDFATALAVISAVMIIMNPFSIFSASYIMSFIAMMGISFLFPQLSRIMNRKIALILSINISITPYLIYAFNIFSPMAIFNNILVVAITGVYVPIGIVSFIWFSLVNHLPFVFIRIMNSLSEMLLEGNTYIYLNGRFVANLCSPSLVVISCLYATIFLISSEFFAIHIHNRRDKRAIIGTVLIIAMLILISIGADKSDFDKAQIVFVDVGQGDCTHIKFSGDLDVLIDGGGRIDFNMGEKVLKPYLLKNGVSDIDLALITHMDTDHYLGIEQLSNSYNVEEIVNYAKCGDIIQIDENDFIEVLWPIENDFSEHKGNEMSSVFKVHCSGVEILVTGDISSEVEAKLIEKYYNTDILSCDILKVAHHGSRYSTSDAFLDVVNPDIAVISVGKYNNYLHPHPSIIEKMNERDIIVYRTDLDGAVGIIIDNGRIIKVCTQKR